MPEADEEVKFTDPMFFGKVTARQSIFMLSVYFLIKAINLPLYTTYSNHYAILSILSFVCAYFDFPKFISDCLAVILFTDITAYVIISLGCYFDEDCLNSAKKLVAKKFKGCESCDVDRETVVYYLINCAILAFTASCLLGNARKASDYRKKRAAEEDEVGVPQLSL